MPRLACDKDRPRISYWVPLTSMKLVTSTASAEPANSKRTMAAKRLSTRYLPWREHSTLARGSERTLSHRQVKQAPAAHDGNQRRQRKAQEEQHPTMGHVGRHRGSADARQVRCHAGQRRAE